MCQQTSTGTCAFFRAEYKRTNECLTWSLTEKRKIMTSTRRKVTKSIKIVVYKAVLQKE
jgi:hypothetical protein